MTSLSQTRYGSAGSPGGERQGRARRWRSYQASSAAGLGLRPGRSRDTIEASDRVGDMSRAPRAPDPATLSVAAAESDPRDGPPHGPRGPAARGRPGLRAIGLAASRLAAPIVGRRGGGVLARLKAEWPAVVGVEL